MFHRFLCALLISALCNVAVAAPKSVLSFEDAWLRETAQGAQVGAGYGVLRNVSAKPIQIVSMTTPVAESVEVHSMTMQDGVMRMRMLDTVVVPAKGRLVLEPGGFHLMLMGLRQPLVAGQSVAMTLTLAGGRTLTVQVPIRSAR